MSLSEPAKDVATARRRRGVTKRSITLLSTRLRILEEHPDDPSKVSQAQQMLKSLEALDSQFKLHHLAVIDFLEEEEALMNEQEVSDEHEEKVATLFTRINSLLRPTTTSSSPDQRKVVSKCLSRLQRSLTLVSSEVDKLKEGPIDHCLFSHRDEQLRELKAELQEISRTILSLDLEDSDSIVKLQFDLEGRIFDVSLNLKRVISSVEKTLSSATSTDSKGVKLPKIDVPVFSGSILDWKTFWEQFSVAVHTRSDISDSEKLVYLRHSVKDGTAKGVIEGLSRSGDHYNEAVECLKTRYDCPRLIHQGHVKKILEAPALKDGNGRELRRLHDTVQQHLRALKAMGYEPSGPFVTSTLELKLDTGTMFEWQKHSQTKTDVPHYQDLLEFLNLQAQASETSMTETKKSFSSELRKNFTKSFTFFATTNTNSTSENCVLCKSSKHPLYSCSKFKALSHDRMLATVKAHSICMNCLKPGHFVKECKSLHRCRECQKPHHSLFHTEAKAEPQIQAPANAAVVHSSHSPSSQCLIAAGLGSTSLLMTCQVMVVSPHGSTAKVRALLDSGSTISFVSSQLAKSLSLPRSQRTARISGIAGLTHNSSSHSFSTFQVCSWNTPAKQFSISAIIVPRVTCSLPTHPVSLDSSWHHLEGLQLADPAFGHPGTIDLLLGIDVFSEALLQGRRVGPSGSPVALETVFGWVLAGAAEPSRDSQLVWCHASVSMVYCDELLRKFWETEEVPLEVPVMTVEEKTVVEHFESTHYRTPDGRFVVSLPTKHNAKKLGESRSQAVRRFLTMERSLHSRKQFLEFAAVVEEYFSLGHAEQVPTIDLQKPVDQVFYLPMHAVYKDSSTTTRIRVVFDASASSSTGISLNDTLMVGPTIHPPLIDVLLRFRLYPVALTADISKVYRAVELVEEH